MGKKEAKSGTLFPVDTKGGRSTTYAGKQALAAALRGAGEPIAAANVEKLGNKKWRFGYNKQIVQLARLECLKTSLQQHLESHVVFLEMERQDNHTFIF